MTSEEIRSSYHELAEILVAYDLGWIVEQVDDHPAARYRYRDRTAGSSCLHYHFTYKLKCQHYGCHLQETARPLLWPPQKTALAQYTCAAVDHCVRMCLVGMGVRRYDLFQTTVNSFGCNAEPHESCVRASLCGTAESTRATSNTSRSLHLHE
jgi:hypothetical protein